MSSRKRERSRDRDSDRYRDRERSRRDYRDDDEYRSNKRERRHRDPEPDDRHRKPKYHLTQTSTHFFQPPTVDTGSRSDRRRRDDDEWRDRKRDRPIENDHVVQASKKQRKGKEKAPKEEKKEKKKPVIQRELTEEEKMMVAMGLPVSFDTTQGKSVDTNVDTVVSTAHHATKRQYRQYMNRKGGFNRLLDSTQ